MRLLRPAMVALASLAVVAACSSSGSDGKPASSTSAAEASLDGVTVSGAAGATPTLALAKTPFTVSKTVTKVLTPGTGAPVTKGQTVRVDFLLVDGRDGKERDTTYGKQSRVFTADPAAVLPGIANGLINEKVGSRLLVAVPPADGFGDTGNTDLDVQKTDTMLFVFDVKAAASPLTAPSGSAVTPDAGLPTVKPDAKGVPQVTIPSGAAPTKLVTQPLIKGKGDVVKAGQSLTVNYVGVIWPGGKIFDSSYAKGTPADFVIGQGQVIKGWDQGLVGQTVGSRVLLVIPPDLGYGAAGKAEAGIKGSDTLIFVVDILGSI